jgi:hypothetical protein
MARTYQPSPATQRKTATTPLDTTGSGSFETQDQRGENTQVGDNPERRENLTSVRDQPDRDDWSQQPPMPSAGMDAFAPVLEAWKQVFKSWSELAETMVKAQQDAFASMISAANTTAKNINVGDRPDSELVFSGSRTTASAPDRIERDRR